MDKLFSRSDSLARHYKSCIKTDEANLYEEVSY